MHSQRLVPNHIHGLAVPIVAATSYMLDLMWPMLMVLVVYNIELDQLGLTNVDHDSS